MVEPAAMPFDMNETECLHLFTSVTHILRRYVSSRFLFVERRRIAEQVFQQILAAGETETGRRPQDGEA